MRSRSTSFVPVLVVLAPLSAARAHPGLHHDIDVLGERLASAADPVAVLIERGRLLRLDDRPAESLADLERAVGLEPSNQDALLQRGLTLAAMQRDARAEADLSRWLAQGGRSAEARAARARIRMRRGNVADALTDLDAAVALRPQVDLYLERGRLQESAGRLDEAAAGYRDGLARLDGAILLREALLRVEIARGRWAEALALIDEELARPVIRTPWLLRRADVLRAAGDSDAAGAAVREALAEAEQAVQRRPTAMNLVLRARARLAGGDSSAAADDLRRAGAMAPRYAEAAELLARLQPPPASGVDDRAR